MTLEAPHFSPVMYPRKNPRKIPNHNPNINPEYPSKNPSKNTQNQATGVTRMRMSSVSIPKMKANGIQVKMRTNIQPKNIMKNPIISTNLIGCPTSENVSKIPTDNIYKQKYTQKSTQKSTSILKIRF